VWRCQAWFLADLLAHAGLGVLGLVRLDELFGSPTGELLTASAPAPGAGWP
jgi:hypothetical protein